MYLLRLRVGRQPIWVELLVVCHDGGVNAVHSGEVSGEKKRKSDTG